MSQAVPETMSGVWLTGHGGPETLVWSDAIPVPRPCSGQVLVRVLAAAINNTDINTRIGWYSSDITGATQDVGEDAEVEEGGWGGALDFPIIQGGDICGEIVALGEGVTTRAIGARVTSQINIPRPTEERPTGFVALGSEIDGAFAQYCLLRADETFDVSRSPLSDVEIAAIPCAFGTAFNMLTRAGVRAGQDVLVTGASGGVGLAAVQLARKMGANVCGITATQKADTVRAAGANSVLGRMTPVPVESFDAVIDVVAGPGWQQLILALRPGGHYAVSGAIAGPIVEADLRDVYLRDITIHGASFMARKVFAELVEMINNGEIKPLISKTYPLSEITAAQEEFIAKTLPGKLVLIPPGVT
ncbi:MAG: zinc-binding dehydrogenase [Amylibacter sp.]